MSATRIDLRFIPQEMITSSPLPSSNTGWRSSGPRLSMMLSPSWETYLENCEFLENLIASVSEDEDSE